MKKEFNLKNLFYDMLKDPKIMFLFVVTILSQSSFIIRSIVLPGIIAKYVTCNTGNFIYIFSSFFILYLGLYLIYNISKAHLFIQIHKYNANILFKKLLNNRENNMNDIPASTYTDIYTVINETSQIVDRFFSVLPLFVSSLAVLYFIIKSINFKFGFSFLVLLVLVLFLSYDFAQKIEKTSRETNKKKNNMINVNEDINKNIISIISYTNFYKEEANITKSINSYIQEYKKAILYGVKLKYVQICLLSTYFIVSIILLKTITSPEIFIKYILAYMGLIQYLSTKGTTISEFFMFLGKLNHSIENVKQSLSSNNGRNIITDNLGTKTINKDIILEIKDLDMTLNNLNLHVNNKSDLLTTNGKSDLLTTNGKSDLLITNSKSDLLITNNKFIYDKFIYDKFIYKDFNLNIRRNKITILKGEIGSGKSTLLKVIFGCLNFDKGHIQLNGIHINNTPLKKWRENIHYIIQHPILFNRSIEENICYPNTKITPKAKELMKILDLEEIFNKILLRKDIGIGGQHLSGGQRQIISVFRVILDNKPMILFDEPTSDLDPENRKKIYTMIEYLKKQGKTLIIATHDKELMKLGDDIIDIIN
jgi:ABC-type multidrug transport system fused ATPase/permease subunit